MKRRTVKQICSILAALVAVLACAFVFFACDRPDANTGEVTISFIIGDAEPAEFSTDAPYVYDALADFCEENGIALEGTWSEYGFFMTRLGNLKPEGSQWIAFYHDIDDITLYDPQHNMDFDGKTWFSSSLGVSSMPLRDGATYLFVLQG